jgi:tRNA (guanine37-N1)-methyltransferase
VPDFQLTTNVFTEKKQQGKTLAEVLENRLPPHLLASLPRAVDVVGDIAIIEIPPELKAHERLIGDAILKTHKNIRTVLAKISAVSGTYRLRAFDVISENTEPTLSTKNMDANITLTSRRRTFLRGFHMNTRGLRRLFKRAKP